MYSTQDIVLRIKQEMKNKKVAMKIMLNDLSMGINTISEFSKGKHLSCISLAQIADYLDCSVDYLLGRETRNHFNIKNTGDNVGVVGQANAPVTIHNGSADKLSDQEVALLDIFSKLDVVKQAKLLVFAAELGKDV